MTFGRIAKIGAVSLATGLILTAGVSWAKFALVDRPAFSSGLKECFKSPLCDPSPYVRIGYPWAYGSYDDSSDTLTILEYRTRQTTDYETDLVKIYGPFVGDWLVFTALSAACIETLSRLLGRKRTGTSSKRTSPSYH